MGAVEDRLHAVIIGGGIGGLLAAKALLSAGLRVTMVDKDCWLLDSDKSIADETLMETAERRRGSPQHIHPHILLTAGKLAMEALMPGFTTELIKRGAEEVDVGTDVWSYDYGGSYARGPTEYKAVGVARRVLEQCLLDRVRADGAGLLQIRDQTKVAGLLWDDGCRSVIGVKLGSGEELKCDVVLDSSGRGSPTHRWLSAVGWAAPAVKVVDARCVYCTRHYTHPEGLPEGRKLAMCWSRPWGTRNATILPGGGGTWQVMLYGFEGDKAPTDEVGYLEFAASLPDSTVYTFLQGATPITPAVRYAATRNERRCYEDVAVPPGLLVFGDAAQARNPAYGQGMAVIAKAALLLSREVSAAMWGAGTASTQSAALRQLSATWHKSLAQCNEDAWVIATSNDLRYPSVSVEGDVPRPPALVTAYVDRVARLAHTDMYAFNSFFAVAHLVRPLAHLFLPLLLLKVLWMAVKEAMGWAPSFAPPAGMPAKVKAGNGGKGAEPVAAKVLIDTDGGAEFGGIGAVLADAPSS